MAQTKWPEYTWDPRARQYRNSQGRFVSRQAVRVALDAAIDSVGAEMLKEARRLQYGSISLIEWQLRMEAHIKSVHIFSAASAAGGWAQATATDWAVAGARIKSQYQYLDRFARKIANGLPLDRRFLARAASYASSGSGTYERVLRRRDLRSGQVLRERRVVHSQNPCASCLNYEAMGWTEPGVLPDTGDECECGQRCRCTFEREMSLAAAA